MPRFNQNMTKFDEIGTFHFLTNFTKNAVASQKVKSQKPVASLQKADKNWNFADLK